MEHDRLGQYLLDIIELYFKKILFQEFKRPCENLELGFLTFAKYLGKTNETGPT